MNKQSTQPHAVKKNQQRNLVIISILALAGCLSLYVMLNKHKTPHKPHDKIEQVDFATPLSHVDAQSIWIERAQNQLAQENKTQGVLQQQLQLLQQNKETQDKAAQQLVQQVQALQTQVSRLQQQMTQRKSIPTNHNSSEQPYSGSLFPAAPGDDNQTQESDGFINEVSLTLTPRKTNYDVIPAKNPNTFVPAGTFVRAITLGGADASAGVTSQADPSPMLFRILDAGTLPNHQKSHLKDCVATAAGVGDISSRRGEIRLERLSCVKDTGQVVEIPVEATVFGPDGKNGVRGNDYWGEGALLERAFAAGTLSGISSGIAQSYTSTSLTPYGQVQTVNNGRILQYGLAHGVGNAAEKLADYNIQRAEQFHPVIQLSAGTVVDIVFLKGFYLDGKKHSDNEPDLLASDSHDVNALSISNQSNNTKGALAPLPLTPQQIQTLKQKNAALGYN